eukprot:CAMPEP_0171379634 /NCGR_PEP_ID=MMETSP0879-20121228/27162_1 /TAXON_ID=67004 /ORGANISM="Thalassiosira weissflogii, Strain CCMP1336" /LENGTH=886 /DNA_ID=CAMNT_0011890463 /DNA_START=97 /DNA_END=2757 /DNA_ORIENTATION=-
MSSKTKNLALAIAVIATHAVVDRVFANTSANRRHLSAFISRRSLGSTLSGSSYFNWGEPHLRPCSTVASKRQSYILCHRLESSSSSDTITGNNNNHDLSSGSNCKLSKEVKTISKDSGNGYSGKIGIEKAISANNGKSSVEDLANQLRERAKSLRVEATSAEQSLRNAVQAKQERDSNEADGWIDLLLGFSTSSSSTDGISNDRNDTTNKTMKSVPAPKTLALRIQEYKLLSSNKIYKIVQRLHDRETKARMVGVEGALLASGTSAESQTIESNINRGSEEKTTNKVLKTIISPGRGFMLGDYENNSLERKKEESEIISGLLNSLLEAVAILEEEKDANSTVSSFSGGDSSKLASKLKAKVADLRLRNEEIIRRKVDTLVLTSNKAVKNQTGNNDFTKGGNGSSSIDDLIRSSMQGNKSSNSTQEKGDKRKKYEKMMKRLIETPEWLPVSIAPFAATSPVEIAASDWKRVKTDLFSSEDLELRCSSWDYTDVAAVYRIKLPKRRPNSREGGSLDSSSDAEGQNKPSITDAFNEIRSRLESHHDLSKKIQLFLVDDNEWKPSFDTARVYELGPPPVIIALAKEVTPEQESERTLTAKSLAAFSTILTLFTTFAYALSSYALNPTFFNSVVRENDITPVPMCLPVFFGVLSLSAIHEIGHLVAAKKYDVKLGSPVPLPSLQVGTFGSITPLRSFPPSRTALFDIAISGPLVSMLASLVMIVSGLNLTIGSESFANFPVLPAAIMRSSFLVGSIASVVAPKVMLAPLSQPLPIHPFFVIGLAGLIMSAINLLPIGRLDGGRTCMASWGRRAANTLSLLTLLGLTFHSFSGASLVILFWGAIVVLSQRQPDIPAVDEFTNIGSVRENCYAALLTIALFALAPFPGGGGPM